MPREREVVRFGPFEADLGTGELRRDGQRVPLQQQPFRILRALLERHGELVTRDELRRLLWEDGTFVSFERGLTSAIRKVREALGDRADAPRYIETLQGRGYRFIAPLVEAGSHAPIPGTASAVPLMLRWAMAAVILAAAALTHRPVLPLAAERLAAAHALSSYACVLKSQGRVEEGLAVIQRAQALAPESARITAEVGFHLHAAGRYEDEFPMLFRAIRMDERSTDAWLHLGLAYARRNDLERALEALHRAEQLAPTDPRVVKWLKRLQDPLQPHGSSA